MSNTKVLFYLPLIIYENGTVNHGINRWRLTCEYNDFHFIKTLVKKIDNYILIDIFFFFYFV